MPPDHSEGLLGKSQRYSLDEIWLSQCTWRPESERRAQNLYRLRDGASGYPFLPLRHGIGRLCSTPVSVKWEKSLSHPQEKKPARCLRNWAKAPLGLKSEKVLIIQSCLTLCNPMDYIATSLFCPLNFPGKNTEVGSCSLLQWIFPTQGSNLDPLHCRQTLYQLSHKGCPWGWLEATWIYHPLPHPKPQPLASHPPLILPTALFCLFAWDKPSKFDVATLSPTFFVTFCQDIPWASGACAGMLQLLDGLPTRQFGFLN